MSSLREERRSHFQAVDGLQTIAEGVSSVVELFILLNCSYKCYQTFLEQMHWFRLIRIRLALLMTVLIFEYFAMSNIDVNERTACLLVKSSCPASNKASGSREVFKAGRCSDLPTFWKG